MKMRRAYVSALLLVFVLGTACSVNRFRAEAPADAEAAVAESTAGSPSEVEAAPAPLEPRRFVVKNSEIVELGSQETGRDYELVVALPPSFESEPERRYPTLYFLDAQWDFALVSMLVGGLHYDEVIPEVLIVGITYGGDSPDYGALRAEDYAPTRHHPNWADGSMGGDAPEFLSFLEGSIIPLVEEKYRADSQHRILSGASFGGLFTLYTLFERPELFHTYLALSPAVDWDSRWIFGREKSFHEQRSTLARRLWLSVGDEEWPHLLEANKDFIRQVEDHAYEDLTLGVRFIDGERHAGNKPEAYNRAIRFAFEEWKAKQPKGE